ncbi:DUF4407 domain-containing protein [Pseudorhodoplanes sp.]|uniref:DUF4407 domain-containing protein n=1 Tax=Pseudorhodoplanes sp. TaxID=1934341 RepID=UPI003D09A44C
MFSRIFYYLAGIDQRIISECPATDRLWATHLGLSLLLAFVVVFGISFHATGYVVDGLPMRAVVSLVIALTIFLFDRAIYQSDWFSQGLLVIGGREQPLDRRRAARITVRLAISLALAFILSIFLELAVFSDTISAKIKQNHLKTNQNTFDDIKKAEAAYDAEIASRKTRLVDLENTYSKEAANEVILSGNAKAQFEALENQKSEIKKKTNGLTHFIADFEKQIYTFQQDMNAEELGISVRPHNTGLAKRGPRYEWAKREKELIEKVLAGKKQELLELDAKTKQLEDSQQRLVAEATAERQRNRADFESKRDNLGKRIEREKLELQEMQALRTARFDSFRKTATDSPAFQKLRDDPLARMTAYQELKNDPKDGGTIVFFSWMTKLFVIFLEVVPVLAKIFFSPPSVYAARIRSVVERESELAFLAKERDVYSDKLTTLAKEQELSKWREELDEAQRRRERAAILQEQVVREFPFRSAGTDRS